MQIAIIILRIEREGENVIINTVNSIETLAGIDQEMESDKETGTLKIRFKEELNEKAKVLMDAFTLGITMTQKQYGKKYVTYKEIQDT